MIKKKLRKLLQYYVINNISFQLSLNSDNMIDGQHLVSTFETSVRSNNKGFPLTTLYPFSTSKNFIYISSAQYISWG